MQASKIDVFHSQKSHPGCLRRNPNN